MIDHQCNINVIESMPAEENYKCARFHRPMVFLLQIEYSADNDKA